MHRFCRIFALVMVACVAPEQQAQPGANGPAPTEKRIYREVSGKKLELWIWKPANWTSEDRRSAIVLFHGGGFRVGGPEQLSRQCARLAHRGMVAVSAQYSLSTSPNVSPVESVKDARSAVRWVRAHAAELGVNPDTLAAGGGSAGAYLAATLSSLSDLNHESDDRSISPKPAALVLWSAVLRQPQANLSPAHHISADHPPTISFHGVSDTNVPIRGVREYAAKVKETGGDFTVIGFEGADHFFSGVEPYASQLLQQAETFLEQHGLLRAGYNDDPLKPGDAAFLSQRAEVPIEAQKLAEYTGYYQIDDKRKFTVVVDHDGRLRIRLTGQTFGPPALLHGGNDLFFARTFSAEFQFGRGGDQKVNGITLHQNNRELRARRTEQPPPMVQFLTREKLNEYVGKYQLDATTAFEITARMGHLFAQSNGQAPLPLFCVRNDHFVYEEVDAAVTFDRNRSGMVTGLMLHQEGVDRRAPRIAR